MYKFYYFRTTDPDGPSWRHDSTPGVLDKSPMAREIWHWMGADAPSPQADDQPSPEADDEVSIGALEQAGNDDARTRAAYQLGIAAREDSGVREALGKLLRGEAESVRRAAAYALGLAGRVAEPVILDACRDAAATTRRLAVAAAGEARLGTAAAIEALFDRLENDPDDLVRSNAAYALGNIGRGDHGAVDPLALIRSLEIERQPDNTENGTMSRSTVRESVTYALTNLTLSEEALARLAEIGLHDHDRYVAGLTVEVLRRHAGTAKPWLGAVLDYLARQRFNVRPPRTAADV